MNKFLVYFPYQNYDWSLYNSDYEKFVYINKKASSLRLYSPIKEPWGKQLLLLPTSQKNRSDTKSSIYRLDLKLFIPEKGLSEGIEKGDFNLDISTVKGKVIVYPDNCRYFALVLRDQKSDEERQTLQGYIQIVIN